ncbi:MAG TPA: hypothetical protein VGQ18_02170 [Gemmatimonadales bacterium]|nr:hypothetical protein [Gemmatimonadales bacterium]
MTWRGMWGVGAWVGAGGIALLISAFAPVVNVTSSAVLRRPPPSSAGIRSYPTDSLARVAVSRDLFRATRRAPSLAYDPQRAASPVDASQPPKPTLTLVGLVGGAEATAVIEGFPGVEGSRVVRVGDAVSGIKVAEIRGNRVRLAGMDTVWVLQVREPWKQ